MISEKQYKVILDKMPIPCVDVVVINKGKVLMVYRNTEPAKNQWWLPGGRLLKHETLEHAALRKVKDEVGLDIIITKKLGMYETMFDKAPFGIKTGVHSINCVFVAKLKNAKQAITIDKFHDESRWVEKIENKFHPYLKQVLKDAKVF